MSSSDSSTNSSPLCSAEIKTTKLCDYNMLIITFNTFLSVLFLKFNNNNMLTKNILL